MSFLTFLQKKFGFFKNNNSQKSNTNNSCDNLSDLTVVKLKAMAKNKGLSGYSRLNKASLVELLKECQ